MKNQLQGSDKQRKVQATILSGIQPTNQITLGNYLGALKNWVKLQREYRCYFTAVDLHSIVTRSGAKNLTNNTYYALAAYLASGINPNHCAIFAQSHLSQHAELAWTLNCFTYMGELNRMTQFKDKSAKEGKNIPAGLFNYPVLMAADILLYQANLVPVGEDQRQHLELTRTLAQRINKEFGEQLFTIPNVYVPKVGAKIMDLRNPNVKMSKSTSQHEGVIFLSDDRETVSQKIKRATTDSQTHIRFDPTNKAGVSNLLTIQAVILSEPIAEVEARYAGQNYGKLKTDTAEIVNDELQKIQLKINEFLTDRSNLQRVIQAGTEQAHSVAQATLQRVYEVIGFAPRF